MSAFYCSDTEEVEIDDQWR